MQILCPIRQWIISRSFLASIDSQTNSNMCSLCHSIDWHSVKETVQHPIHSMMHVSDLLPKNFRRTSTKKVKWEHPNVRIWGTWMTWFGFLELAIYKTFHKRNCATSNTFHDACIGSSSKEFQKNKYQESKMRTSKCAYLRNLDDMVWFLGTCYLQNIP